MRLRFAPQRLHLPSRRPSPALIIALVALFVSLGGAAYAATQLPAGSVGTRQLQNNAVSYLKIQPRAVGRVRANLGQIQARINTTCAVHTAVASVDQNGKVSCNPTLPAASGVTNTQTVNGSLTPINGLNLDGPGNYMEFANPTATVTGNGVAQRVTITCLLQAASGTQSRSVTVDTGGTTSSSSVSIPLQQATTAGESNVACSATTTASALPAISITSSLNAIQTAS